MRYWKKIHPNVFTITYEMIQYTFLRTKSAHSSVLQHHTQIWLTCTFGNLGDELLDTAIVLLLQLIFDEYSSYDMTWHKDYSIGHIIEDLKQWNWISTTIRQFVLVWTDISLHYWSRVKPRMNNWTSMWSRQIQFTVLLLICQHLEHLDIRFWFHGIAREIVNPFFWIG